MDQEKRGRVEGEDDGGRWEGGGQKGTEKGRGGRRGGGVRVGE